jgi:hypothetical protein
MNACNSVNYRDKAYRINMAEKHLPCFPLAAAQGLLPCSL